MLGMIFQARYSLRPRVHLDKEDDDCINNFPCNQHFSAISNFLGFIHSNHVVTGELWSNKYEAIKLDYQADEEDLQFVMPHWIYLCLQTAFFLAILPPALYAYIFCASEFLPALCKVIYNLQHIYTII